MSSFAVFLKNLIEIKKLNQSQVSIYSGASESAVSLWLSGKRIPNPTSLKRLAPVLNISVEELMKKAGYLEEESRIKEIPESNTRTIDVTGIDDEGVSELEHLADFLRKKSREKNEVKKATT